MDIAKCLRKNEVRWFCLSLRPNFKITCFTLCTPLRTAQRTLQNNFAHCFADFFVSSYSALLCETDRCPSLNNSSTGESQTRRCGKNLSRRNFSFNLFVAFSSVWTENRKMQFRFRSDHFLKLFRQWGPTFFRAGRKTLLHKSGKQIRSLWLKW